MCSLEPGNALSVGFFRVDGTMLKAHTARRIQQE